jgi:GT2 family glycosyltransferase
MISYIIPTRNRPSQLAATLAAIDALGEHDASGGAEVIVVDNASQEPVCLPPLLHRSGTPIKQMRLESNEGASARNRAAHAADPSSRWLVMLDDDSAPDNVAFLETLENQPADVAAVSADIWLVSSPNSPTARRVAPSPPPPRVREQGGLPEVFIGCGVAIRRDLFLALGGYDPAFDYYAEEYDLAARMLLAGLRVRFEPGFHVIHRKVAAGRDMNTILARLVRNNGWVAQRYAPDQCRLTQIRELRQRYRAIAAKESATLGFAHGLQELRRTLRQQTRTPLPHAMWDRFTGLAAARSAIALEFAIGPFRTASIVEEGKNAWAVRAALEELGVRIVPLDADAEVLVIGTMSPGPMLDAGAKWGASLLSRRVIAPWNIAGGAGDATKAARLAA